MTHHFVLHQSSPQRDSGNILFVSLILLLVVTVIGISTISTTGLNEKMAANYRDHNLAFQAAEAALKAGEQRARDISAIFDGVGLTGIPAYFSCTSTNCFTSTCLNGLCFNGTYPATSSGSTGGSSGGGGGKGGGGGGGSTSTSASTAGICSKTNPTPELWETAATWTTSGRYSEHPVSISGLAAKPKYIVEFMCYAPADPDTGTTTVPPNYGTDWWYMYRITALGVGKTSASKAMIQSTYKVAR